MTGMDGLAGAWRRRLLALVAGLALALGVSGVTRAGVETDGNNTQCNTNNGVTVCTEDDVDDTLDEGDDEDDGGSNNGGNNNDGDGIVNS